MIISVFQLGTTDLQQFLIAILSSGLMGTIVSWFTEQLPLWQTAPRWLPAIVRTNWSGYKRWLMFIGTVLLPFLVALATGNTPQFIVQSPYWQGLFVQGLVVWLGSQAGHSLNPQRVKPYANLLIQLLTNKSLATSDILNLIETLEAKTRDER